jgi:hypothetical protein
MNRFLRSRAGVVVVFGVALIALDGGRSLYARAGSLDGVEEKLVPQTILVWAQIIIAILGVVSFFVVDRPRGLKGWLACAGVVVLVLIAGNCPRFPSSFRPINSFPQPIPKDRRSITQAIPQQGALVRRGE